MRGLILAGEPRNECEPAGRDLMLLARELLAELGTTPTDTLLVIFRPERERPDWSFLAVSAGKEIARPRGEEREGEAALVLLARMETGAISLVPGAVMALGKEGRGWGGETCPFQYIVLLRGFCARNNSPCIAPFNLQSLPYCNTIARPLRKIRPAPPPPFLRQIPYNIDDGNIV